MVNDELNARQGMNSSLARPVRFAIFLNSPGGCQKKENFGDLMKQRN